MLLDICLGSRSAWKILFVLAEAPGKGVSRKEIQQLTLLGNKVVTKFLAVLEKFDLILVQKTGKRFFYKLNMNSPFAEGILSVYNLEKKANHNLDFFILNILREFVYELTNINLENLKQVILFGSYAKRTYHKESDIDAAIVVKEKAVEEELLITELVDKIKKRFNKQIQPHFLTGKEFEGKSRLAEEIKRDGIVLLP